MTTTTLILCNKCVKILCTLKFIIEVRNISPFHHFISAIHKMRKKKKTKYVVYEIMLVRYTRVGSLSRSSISFSMIKCDNA